MYLYSVEIDQLDMCYVYTFYMMRSEFCKRYILRWGQVPKSSLLLFNNRDFSNNI